MAVAAVVGDKMVGLDDLENAYREHGHELDDFLKKSQPDTSFSMNITAGLELGHTDLERARDASSDIIPFQGIGLGKPLTVIVETVYVGDYPDTLRWVPGFNRGDILVTSAHKAFQNFDAAPRAIHLLEKDAGRRVHLKADAVHQGSQLIYYTPAVTETSTLFTVEVSSDREFSDKLAESLGKAVAAAGALPVFAPAAPYLVAAGVAIPIAAEAAKMLARPSTYYEETVTVNFGLAGIERAQAHALVLYPGQDESKFSGYTLSEGNVLRDGHKKPYDGELPYVVLSLDGTEHPDLDAWTAQAASAVMLERFFTPDELLSKALTLATESLSLYNDVEFQKRAAGEWQAASKSTGEAKAKHEELAKAYVKNIQNDAIRNTVERA